MDTPDAALGRLEHNWVYGNFLAGLALLVLAPLFARAWPLAVTLAYLQLPVYMLHQYEEHDNNRFAKSINEMLGGGREILSASVIFLVNIPGVYGVTLVSIWLAATLDPGWGLIGLYLILINAIIHIVSAVVSRRYNPGLVTSIVLFLPLSVATIWVLTATGHASALQHLVGLFVSLVMHGAIVIYALSRRRALMASPKAAS